MSGQERLAEQWPKLSETLRVMIARARANAKAPADGFKPIDIETLRREIAYAAYRYEAGPWTAPTFGAYTLDEVAGPVDKVLAIMRNPANDVVAFGSLGDGDFAKGRRQFDALVGLLERLKAVGARPRPGVRPNGRPPNVYLLRLARSVVSKRNVQRAGAAWDEKTRYSKDLQ